MLKYEVMPSLDRTILKSNSHGLSSALEIKVETCSSDLQIDSWDWCFKLTSNQISNTRRRRRRQRPMNDDNDDDGSDDDDDDKQSFKFHTVHRSVCHTSPFPRFCWQIPWMCQQFEILRFVQEKKAGKKNNVKMHWIINNVVKREK